MRHEPCLCDQFSICMRYVGSLQCFHEASYNNFSDGYRMRSAEHRSFLLITSGFVLTCSYSVPQYCYWYWIANELKRLTSKYSSIPYLEPSLPSPDCLTPPCGVTYEERYESETGINQSPQINIWKFSECRQKPLMKRVLHWFQQFHIPELLQLAKFFEHSYWICKQPGLYFLNSIQHKCQLLALH